MQPLPCTCPRQMCFVLALHRERSGPSSTISSFGLPDSKRPPIGHGVSKFAIIHQGTGGGYTVGLPHRPWPFAIGGGYGVCSKELWIVYALFGPSFLRLCRKFGHLIQPCVQRINYRVKTTGNIWSGGQSAGKFSNGCRIFRTQRIAVPDTLTRLSVHTLAFGDGEYIVGMSLTTTTGHAIRLGYCSPF